MEEYLFLDFTFQMFCERPSIPWWFSSLYLQPCPHYRVTPRVCDIPLVPYLELKIQMLKLEHINLFHP